MNLEPAPHDTGNGYFERLVSPLGVCMALHPVLFGWRVIGYYENDFGLSLNWCAGNDHANVERLYSLMRSVLLAREDGPGAFRGLPGVSSIKPFHRDARFVEVVSAAAGPNLALISLPPLDLYRAIWIAHLSVEVQPAQP